MRNLSRRPGFYVFRDRKQERFENKLYSISHFPQVQKYIFLLSKLITRDNNIFSSLYFQFISKEKLMDLWKNSVFDQVQSYKKTECHIRHCWFWCQNGISTILEKLVFQTWKMSVKDNRSLWEVVNNVLIWAFYIFIWFFHWACKIVSNCSGLRWVFPRKEWEVPS